MDEEVALMNKLDMLRNRHQELDDTIDNLSGVDYMDELQVRRLKKEKLALREQIFQIEQVVYPDIIA